ncbi:MAG: IS200/IS605 family transposase [Victivallales bacterium]|jgi:putative transposase|nr:IS200/IS605 family transposase [Victivallales bacterium]
MAQSLAKILLHVVFSTKNREPWIDDALQPHLHSYLAKVCRSLGSEAYRVGGTDDHVHVACTLPRTLATSKLLEKLKAVSSAWIKEQAPQCHRFTWQAGYGAFSLGQSQLPALLRYIDGQREHHRSRTFKEELLEIIRLYETDADERYLWD